MEQGKSSVQVREAQLKVLRDLAADVVVLTEPGAPYDNRAEVASPSKRTDSLNASAPWVAIVGHGAVRVDLDIPYERMAIAATIDVCETPLAVYGSVLPWTLIATNAPDLLLPGETSAGAFLRVLREQVTDVREVRRRYPDHLLIWAGDFNQHLVGPNCGGTHARRKALAQALDELELVAWNADAENAHEGLAAIDLICGPRNMRVIGQGRISPSIGPQRLSDHAGYWVDL